MAFEDQSNSDFDPTQEMNACERVGMLYKYEKTECAKPVLFNSSCTTDSCSWNLLPRNRGTRLINGQTLEQSPLTMCNFNTDQACPLF